MRGTIKIINTEVLNGKSNNRFSFSVFKKKIVFFVLIFLLIISLLLVPKSFYKTTINRILAFIGVYTEEIREVTIDSNDYSSPGSYRIIKSSKWIDTNKAQVTIKFSSKRKSIDTRHKDIILVLDASSSMQGNKLSTVKEDSISLINSILQDTDSRIALVTFNSTATVVSNFSNNRTNLVSLVNNIVGTGDTNYRLALDKVSNIMSSYQERDNTDCIVLFLTDGYPTVDTPIEKAIYSSLKDNFSYLNIYGIQYEMGNDIVDEVKDISDYQYTTDMNSLDNTLMDIVKPPVIYEDLIISESIDDDYFENTSNIKIDDGTTSISNNTITWDLSGYKSGYSTTLSFDVDLKSNINNDFVPISKSIMVEAKLENETNNNINSSNTTVLKTKYGVIYNGNAPDGCTVSVPSTVYYSMNSVVSNNASDIFCDGYIFKGWKIKDDDDITYINSNTLLMPDSDVTIMGEWTRHNIIKSMDGDVNTHATLYKVLQDEAESNGLAKKYTGSHHDSYTDNPSKDIYHWYASNDSGGNQVQEKNNVIFAGMCWQMIRTTDTGGVKLLYNGIAENNKCLSTRSTHVGVNGGQSNTSLAGNYWYGTDYIYDENTNSFKLSGTLEQVLWSNSTWSGLIGKYTCRNTDVNGTCSKVYLVSAYKSNTNGLIIPIDNNVNYSLIGYTQYNNISAPTMVGYMYTHDDIPSQRAMSGVQNILSSNTLDITYYYADSVTYDSNNNTYKLDNPFKINSVDDYPSLDGKYTIRNIDGNATSSSVHYIASVSNNTYYYIGITGGNTLSYYNATYSYSDSYIDNGNGTYSLNNPVTINQTDWADTYSSITGKYICKDPVNNVCNTLWYSVEATATQLKSESIGNIYKYAKGFTYENGVYTLNNESTLLWNNFAGNLSTLNNAHYTCWNTSGTCTSISYIIKEDRENLYYYSLTGGDDISDFIEEINYSDTINTKDSIIKVVVDKWYKNNMLDFDQYIEDTVFCNNRTIVALNAWDPDGGSVHGNLVFREHVPTDNLSCENDTDKFSTLNSKARLNYKVALVTSSEIKLFNNRNAAKNPMQYWTMSPAYYSTANAGGVSVSSIGNLQGIYVGAPFGVRPVISLIPNIEYRSGDGSKNSPYIVELPEL